MKREITKQEFETAISGSVRPAIEMRNNQTRLFEAMFVNYEDFDGHIVAREADLFGLHYDFSVFEKIEREIESGEIPAKYYVFDTLADLKTYIVVIVCDDLNDDSI